MSNLDSVKVAIRAEIEHAKKGAAYYQTLVTTLEQALAKLDSVDADAVAPKGVFKKSKTGGEIEQPKHGRKSGSRNKNGDAELPSTGKDFWPSLITDQPQSAADILNAAIEKLGITPTPEQRKKLSQRATFALNNLVKTNAIADTGSGRGRRFLKKQ